MGFASLKYKTKKVFAVLAPESSIVIPKEIKFRKSRVGENVFCSALIEIKKNDIHSRANIQ